MAISIAKVQSARLLPAVLAFASVAVEARLPHFDASGLGAGGDPIHLVPARCDLALQDFDYRPAGVYADLATHRDGYVEGLRKAGIAFPIRSWRPAVIAGFDRLHASTSTAALVEQVVDEVASAVHEVRGEAATSRLDLKKGSCGSDASELRSLWSDGEARSLGVVYASMLPDMSRLQIVVEIGRYASFRRFQRAQPDELTLFAYESRPIFVVPKGIDDATAPEREVWVGLGFDPLPRGVGAVLPREKRAKLSMRDRMSLVRVSNWTADQRVRFLADHWAENDGARLRESFAEAKVEIRDLISQWLRGESPSEYSTGAPLPPDQVQPRGFQIGLLTGGGPPFVDVLPFNRQRVISLPESPGHFIASTIDGVPPELGFFYALFTAEPD